MLFIVLIILLIIAIMLSLRHDSNYANPIFIVLAVFAVGCIVAAANMVRWDFELSSESFLIILSVLASWVMGCLVGENISIKTPRLSFRSKAQGGGYSFSLLNERNLSDLKILVGTLIQLVLVGYYIAYYLRAVGGVSSLFFSILRDQMMTEEEVPFLIGHIILITRSIAMIFIYHCVKAIINREKINALKDLPPILIYFVLEIFGTSRSGFVYIGGYIVVMYLLLYYKKNGRSRQLAKRTRNTITKVAIVVVAAFILLGNLTGKTQYMGIIDMMSMYVGAPICNIQYYLENSIQFVSPYFGAYTQPFLSSVQRALHVSGTETTNLYYPFVKYGDTRGRTNIYSALVKPLIDYGFGGTIIFYFLCGLFIGAVYKRVLKEDCSKYRIIMYGYLAMPLFLFGLEYQIGNYWLATRTIYVVVYTFILNKLFKGELAYE